MMLATFGFITPVTMGVVRYRPVLEGQGTYL